MVNDVREIVTVVLFSVSMVMNTESFVVDTLTNKCLPRSPACLCETTKAYKDGGKEVPQSNIYCDETSSDVFPDFSVITKPIIDSFDWYIGLSKNNLTSIPGGLFTGFAPVNLNATYIFLDLNQNRISKIENNAFVGMENVYLEMDLTYNNLTNIPFAFLLLKQLRGLSLEFNPIKVMDQIVLQHIAPTLTYYDLGIGNMTSWPAELSSFTDLFTAALYDVEQYKLPRQPFYGSKNKIDAISIIRSDLTMLPCYLTDLTALTILAIHETPYLNATHIVEVCPTNYSLLKLQKLELVEGALKEFPNILKYTPLLKKLYLDHNQIQYVNGNFIPMNSVLEGLVLSYNNLQTIPGSFLRFQHLRELNLDHNNIATMVPGLERIILQNPEPNLCLRYNPINTTSLTAKCSPITFPWRP